MALADTQGRRRRISVGEAGGSGADGRTGAAARAFARLCASASQGCEPERLTLK